MIKIDNLVKYYGYFQALDGISFEVQKGEILGLLGPNGAGKTTTLRILTGYLDATAGNIDIGGYDVKADQLKVKQLIGYLPESAPLYSDMIVYDFLVFAGKVRKMDKDLILKRIDYLASVCGIKEVMSRNINELSKGFRQRVGLAYAILHDPAILILDEPTSGLDPNQIIEIRELIKELGKKKTVILSTHILPEVEATCDRVVIINRGRIVVDDTPAGLSSHSKGDSRVSLKIKTNDKDGTLNILKNMKGVKSISGDSDESDIIRGFSIVPDDGLDLREDIFKIVVENNLTLVEMKRETASLEDVFRQLTQGGAENE